MLGLVTLLVAGRRRARAVGHQARDRVLDDEPDRLHVRRRGDRRVRFAMFHLVTHAFFKALLFLTAGIVIHHLTASRTSGRWAACAVDAVHARDVPDRHARARRHPDLRRLLVEGRDPRLGARRGRCARLDALRRRLLGTLLTGMYALRLYFLVFHGKPATLRTPRTTTHTTARARAGCSFPWACWRSARRSRDCCRSRASGTRSTTGSTSRRAARPPVDGQEWLTSGVAVTLGVLGAYLAWRAFTPVASSSRGRRATDPRAQALVRRGVRHRLRTPGQAIAVRLRDQVETPVVQGGLDEVAEGTLDAARDRVGRPDRSAPAPTPSRSRSPCRSSSSSSSWSAEQC